MLAERPITRMRVFPVRARDQTSRHVRSVPALEIVCDGLVGRKYLGSFPASMLALLAALLAALRSSIRSRLELEAEILALLHRLAVLQRQAPRRPRLPPAYRLVAAE
jgi:hypothetical protein